MNWNDKKKVDEFVKRQQNYKQMMERQTENLEETLQERKEDDPSLQNKKSELQKRIEELKRLNKQQKLLDELQKMAEKLDKEDLIERINISTRQLAKAQKTFFKKVIQSTELNPLEPKQENISNIIQSLKL